MRRCSPPQTPRRSVARPPNRCSRPEGPKGWRLATLVERSLAARVPLFGVSLVLNHPVFAGLLRGYPYEPEAAERIARSRLRLAFSAAPDSVRRRVLRTLRGTRTTAAVLAGPPSVAHAEALLRAIELRAGDPRRAARRPRDRDPRNHPVPAARAAEPAPCRLPRARARARALARRLSGPRRRDRDPRPRLPADLRPADAAAVPRLLPLRPDRPRPGVCSPPRRMPSPRMRAPSRSTAPAAPCTPCCRSATGRRAGPRSSGSAPSTSRERATPPWCGSSASSRSAASAPLSRWPAATAAPTRVSAFSSRPPYFPLRVGSGDA